ncbi:MAG: reactive intermediate/imine deaminase [Candidatus Stahlbacteria bacterium]|nr:Rid family detoxifying hydrolase [candidate division WOR-3 bacterium]TET60797.1 MAG: reactive intermediate/imine deaminase [Candidatus Stahlbacteria bacterium]
MKKIIKTANAPEAIGPYSQAVVAGDFVFTAGQIAISPETNKLINGNVAEQTKQVLDNLEAVIKASGTKLSSVVKTTVYLIKPEDFAPMNEVYATYFSNEPPARVTVFVSSLPKGALVEIDATAKL